MKVYFNRFEETVRKGGIDCFLITGEEPWQRLTACDIVRAHAGKNGYVRTMFFAGAGFDAGELVRASNVGNLFGGERRLLDLRIDGTVSAALSDAIKDYIAEPPQDTLLMIQVAKVDARKACAKIFCDHAP